MGICTCTVAMQTVCCSPALLLMSCRMRGLLVTMPEPRGRKSLHRPPINERHMKSTQEGRASSMQYVHVFMSMLLTILGLTLRLGVPSPHRPTKFSSTELFPALCPPITAIWGRSMGHAMPRPEKASCSWLTSGISSCMPWLPAMTALETAE